MEVGWLGQPDLAPQGEPFLSWGDAYAQTRSPRVARASRKDRGLAATPHHIASVYLLIALDEMDSRVPRDAGRLPSTLVGVE